MQFMKKRRKHINIISIEKVAKKVQSLKTKSASHEETLSQKRKR